jgi:nucleotide-binding universal stress UspA family protein
LATHQESRVIAVHVIDPLLAEAAASLSGAAQLKADAQAELKALGEAERRAAPGSPAITSIVRIGPPAREILASAKTTAAALVVMGTQGLGGFRKLFFGSIAEKVLRDASVPVLAVPSPESADTGGASNTASETSVPDIDVVIASVELDDSAEAVIGHAVSFARAFGLPLILLHVVPPVEGMPRAVEAARAAERRHEANAQARLSQLAGRVGSGQDLAATPEQLKEVEVEVRCGPAAEEIAAAAASRHALVTISSGGDNAHHRPGSIAYRVLCLSDAPVLAVPFRSAR